MSARFKDSVALLCSVLFVLLIIKSLIGFAQNETGQDVTQQCVIQMSGTFRNQALAFDGKYGTGWMRYDKSEYTIAVELPANVHQGGLYLCFLKQPTRLVCKNEKGEFYPDEGYGFAHRYIPFITDGTVIIHLWGDEKGFSLSEMHIFSGQEPPDWVQRW